MDSSCSVFDYLQLGYVHMVYSGDVNRNNLHEGSFH